LAAAPVGASDGASLWSLEADQLTVLNANGTIHSTTLPCKTKSLWPLSHGVLIGTEDDDAICEAGARQPRLLRLRHPLDHVHGVSSSVDWDDAILLTLCVPPLSLVLSFNARTGQHAVWVLSEADGTLKHGHHEPNQAQLRRIWHVPTAQQAEDSFFLCASSSSAYLCLVQAEPGQLLAFRIGLPGSGADGGVPEGALRPESRPCGGCPAVAARPIYTPGSPERTPQLACLAADGTVSIWMLSACELHKVLSCTVPVASAPPRALFGPRAGAELEPGMTRLLPFHDELTELCFAALESVLGARAYAGLLARVHAAPQQRGGAAGTAGGGVAVAHPWSLFRAGLCGLLGTATTTAAPPSAWDELLASRVHTRLVSSATVHGLASAPAHYKPPAAGIPRPPPPSANHGAEAHDCLHAAYESLKLNTLAWPMLGPLGLALSELAAALGRSQYCDHYTRDLGGFRSGVAAPTGTANAPLDVFSAASGLSAAGASAAGGSALAVAPLPPGRLEHCGSARFCADLARVYALSNTSRAAGAAPPPAEQMALAMARWRFGAKHLEAMPLGVALPLLEAIRACRHLAPADWPQEAYSLIAREDLARQLQPVARSAPITLAPANLPFEAAADDPDGMHALILKSGLRFRRDLRLNEVRRLLCSSRPIALSAGGPNREVLEHDMVHEQQARLALLCRRSMALSVGRGMFTLASSPAEFIETLRLAPLVLKGHTSPKGATIELDTATFPPDHLMWPDFHNGCASALRLSPPGCGQVQHGELGRHWIMYSKPKARQHAYAGFLMGLGLQVYICVCLCKSTTQ